MAQQYLAIGITLTITRQAMNEVTAQEAQRILGRTVGRELNEEEVAAVSGAYWSDPDPDYTMPWLSGKEWHYGDMA